MKQRLEHCQRRHFAYPGTLGEIFFSFFNNKYMEGEKKHNEIDQYMKNAIIEHEFDYPERKGIRERDKQVLEHSYPNDESRYEGALQYLWGDFIQFLNVFPPESEDKWKFIKGAEGIKTVEEHYSQHPRYPLYAPILLKAAPEEVRKQNEFVHRMNEAIEQKDVEAINRIREEAFEFRQSIWKKWAEIVQKKQKK